MKIRVVWATCVSYQSIPDFGVGLETADLVRYAAKDEEQKLVCHLVCDLHPLFFFQVEDQVAFSKCKVTLQSYHIHFC